LFCIRRLYGRLFPECINIVTACIIIVSQLVDTAQSYDASGEVKIKEPTYLDPSYVVVTAIEYLQRGFKENKSKYGIWNTKVDTVDESYCNKL